MLGANFRDLGRGGRTAASAAVGCTSGWLRAPAMKTCFHIGEAASTAGHHQICWGRRGSREPRRGQEHRWAQDRKSRQAILDRPGRECTCVFPPISTSITNFQLLPQDFHKGVPTSIRSTSMDVSTNFHGTTLKVVVNLLPPWKLMKVGLVSWKLLEGSMEV